MLFNFLFLRVLAIQYVHSESTKPLSITSLFNTVSVASTLVLILLANLFIQVILHLQEMNANLKFISW